MRSRLALRIRRGMGFRPGEHRVPRETDAAGLEIDGFRAYVPGDDLRHLDWLALARLDLPLVRRFTAEREAPVHLLLDTSASMGVPAGDGKLAAAAALAEALAAMALAAGDPVRVTFLGGDTVLPGRVVFRHRQAMPHVRTLLAHAEPAGTLDLGLALAAYARGHVRSGAALVLSDCHGDPAALATGLAALRARRYEAMLFHVLGPAELDPAREFAHAVLEDVESGETRTIRLTAATKRRYAEVLAAHLDAVEAAAVRTGVGYARLVAGTPTADFVAGELVRRGLVRRR